MSVEEPVGWPEDATWDALVGDWSLYQRTGGHKTSTDDVLTACAAFEAVGGVAPARYLDLGCGIGSVLLLTSHALRPERALGIEAQRQSALMAQATVKRQAQLGFAQVRQGDFREALGPEEQGAFDLVTGSPPYFPVGTGTLPADYQRRACRFELRGGVEAYCEAAAFALAEEGVFCLVFQSQWEDRVMDAAGAAGLHVRRRMAVQMRTDRPQPFLTVYELRRQPGEVATVRFSIREADGRITDAYRARRTQIGLSTEGPPPR